MQTAPNRWRPGTPGGSGQAAGQGSRLRLPFYNFDLLVGEVVKLVDELVDLSF